MKTGLNLRQTTSQTLAMTPQLQQAIRLLQLSTTELQAEIQENLDKNPLLEIDENSSQSNIESLDAMFEKETNKNVADDDFNPFNNDNTISNDDAQFANYDNANNDNNVTPLVPDDSSYNHENGIDNNQSESSMNAEDKTWAESFSVGNKGSKASFDGDGEEYQGETSYNLKEHLLWQLNLSPYTDKDKAIAEAIIDGINESGYLNESLEDIQQAVISEFPDTEIDEIEVVLKLIQNFDPIGVGARTIKESLLIQLNQYDLNDATNKIAYDIVNECLELLGNKDYKKIIKQLGIKENQLKDAIQIITNLEPRPGNVTFSNKNEFIIPDIAVTKINGVWTATLNPNAIPKLKINETYSELSKSVTSEADTQYFKNHIQEANWFIQSINKRNETLLKVAQCIIDQQTEFLEKGEVGMKPLVLNDVAMQVEMHESTVSRVTTEKYMHTPRGTFELKYFFSSHVSTDNGGEFSSMAIRSLLKELVKNENPKKPLSDNQLSEIFQTKGIMVARRTIAKYREALGIPSSSQRKQII